MAADDDQGVRVSARGVVGAQLLFEEAKGLRLIQKGNGGGGGGIEMPAKVAEVVYLPHTADLEDVRCVAATALHTPTQESVRLVCECV